MVVSIFRRKNVRSPGLKCPTESSSLQKYGKGKAGAILWFCLAFYKFVQSFDRSLSREKQPTDFGVRWVSDDTKSDEKLS